MTDKVKRNGPLTPMAWAVFCLWDTFCERSCAMTPATSPGRIEMLNGVPIYFEVHGNGDPLLLLHGFSAWRHDEAAADMFALLDHLGIETLKGMGVSGGGNVLLHMATKQPERVKAMVLVSATSYFPAQARPIMRAYPDSLPAEERENLRRRHPGGDGQIEALLASTKAFADSYDDMNFTPPYLGRITARTLIVQGDRD